MHDAVLQICGQEFSQIKALAPRMTVGQLKVLIAICECELESRLGSEKLTRDMREQIEKHQKEIMGK